MVVAEMRTSPQKALTADDVTQYYSLALGCGQLGEVTPLFSGGDAELAMRGAGVRRTELRNRVGARFLDSLPLPRSS